MALYAYRAIDADGNVVSGRMPSINDRELEGRLRSTGLEVIESRLVRQRRFFGRGRVSRKELIVFCFHMEQTLRGGVMVTEALNDLAEGLPNGPFRNIVTVMLGMVREGTPLSVAMQEYPTTFDGVFIGLVHAGEESGNLYQVFDSLGGNLRWVDELASKVKKMLMYPAFTLTVLIAVSVFLLVYLVPQLATFIREASGGQLPLQTRMLLVLSDLLIHHWSWFLLTPVCVVITTMLIVRAGGARLALQIDRLALRIPMIGGIIERVVLARFASLFGMLYAAGVPVLHALGICQQTAGNRWIAAGLGRATDFIVQGKGLTEAFQLAELFPRLILRMLKIGETTGEIDKALKNVTYFYNREIDETVGQVEAMVEPALTLILGVLLGWLMVAVLGPIYDVLGKMKV